MRIDDETLRLGRAVPRDTDAIAALLATHAQRDIADTKRHVLAWFRTPTTHLFVAARTDGIAGYARLRKIARGELGTGPAGWYLAGLIVDPTPSRKGIGSALVAARLRWLAQHRVREAYYFANHCNAASIALHAKFGFAIVDDRFAPEGVFEAGSGVLGRLALTPRSG